MPLSVATTVIVSGVPAVKAMAAEALPEVTGVPWTVITPLPVGVTVMLATAFSTVTPL